MSTTTLTLDHTTCAWEDGAYWPVAGSSVEGLTQLVCEDHSTPVDSYLKPCPTCHGRLTLPKPVTGVNLTISFLSYKGRVTCPTCHAFGQVSCDELGNELDD